MAWWSGSPQPSTSLRVRLTWSFSPSMSKPVL
ncbi:hypothetical protein E2C01_029029 [Portunus trituberculatus]|uniref:Uncharacterized protein n=1 Tax=Portunus trituberculatus TaxID=210409 RepID=A0A5B7ERQ6_PORTR|nr:hypothetical protein [Portunus trituberculatus]